EPYHRTARTTAAHTTAAPTTKKDIVAGKTRDFNLDARHSKKMKEDFTGGGGGLTVLMTAEKTDANQPLAAATSHGNEKEIDVQLFWLEKIYALNKQLQREEEMLLKLHAKIRKHQVKRAYQTKREVVQQIEKLDAELTLQCCDIRAVESKLHASNEQLKQKLGVLERLSQEFLETMDQAAPAAEAEEQSVAEVAADADSEATVNRMPDVINNEDHNLATEMALRATATMARENKLQEATVDQLHAKQMTTVEFGGQQQGCQLQSQRSGVADEDVWHRQNNAKLHLPHAIQSATQALHTDLNGRSDSKALGEESTAAAAPTTGIVTVPSSAEDGEATRTTTAAAEEAAAMAASHSSAAAFKLTATSCAVSSSSARMTAAVITTTTTTRPLATTINATADVTTVAATACNMPAMSPAEGKPTTALHLAQLQLPQLQQEQLPLPAVDNSQQCVDADDVLVDAHAAVGGVVLPQSNYPISCINHAAIHATSQLSTRQIIVAAGGDGLSTAVAGKLTPEQTLSAAYATVSSSSTTSSSPSPSSPSYPSSLSMANASIMQQQQQLQQQPHQYQPQILPHRQHININSYMHSNCASNYNNNNTNHSNSKDNHTNDKNLLPPSHAAHTKTLQKQMFGPKSLNQMLPAAPPPKIIQVSAAPMSSTPSTSTIAVTPCPHAGFGIPSMLAPLRPTTPTALLPPTPVMPFDVTTQRSSVDITQLGTLV
ncbi:PREDICTED: putative GPI-anchored protein PB15E9.01c, partial [Rhagoletis zephyria]|uniref:putative GPI-anchored protein PB15E9.01c n=1 Tax=Rhagoletis zephyria TaxID=28612 RepID=UPI00081128A5